MPLAAAAAATAEAEASLRRLPLLLLLDDAASGGTEAAPVPAPAPAPPASPSAPASLLPASSNLRRLHSGASELLGALVLVQEEPVSERDMPTSSHNYIVYSYIPKIACRGHTDDNEICTSMGPATRCVWCVVRQLSTMSTSVSLNAFDYLQCLWHTRCLCGTQTAIN